MANWVFDNQFWQSGLTSDEFIDGMKINQEDMKRRIEEINFSHHERLLISSLTQDIFVIVVSEDWCGDSLMNLPIIVKLSKICSHIHLRIFVRSAHPELRAYFADRGITNIPTFYFLDDKFCEIGVWVERPKKAYPILADWKAKHPEMEAIRNAPNLSKEEKRELLKPFTQKLNKEMENWYADGLQHETISEIMDILHLHEKGALN